METIGTRCQRWPRLWTYSPLVWRAGSSDVGGRDSRLRMAAVLQGQVLMETAGRGVERWFQAASLERRNGEEISSHGDSGRSGPITAGQAACHGLKLGWPLDEWQVLPITRPYTRPHPAPLSEGKQKNAIPAASHPCHCQLDAGSSDGVRSLAAHGCCLVAQPRDPEPVRGSDSHGDGWFQNAGLGGAGVEEEREAEIQPLAL